MTLITKDFSTGYQNNEIIKSINITLRNKEWLGIIGPNGSGKSTFLKGISRILKPSSGLASINEYDIHLASSNAIAKEISILPQLQTLDLQMSVYELVCLGRSPHKRWWETDLNEKDLIKAKKENITKEKDILETLPFVTIDGEDAKDFDDAIFCKLFRHKSEHIQGDILSNRHNILTQ